MGKDTICFMLIDLAIFDISIICQIHKSDGERPVPFDSFSIHMYTNTMNRDNIYFSFSIWKMSGGIAWILIETRLMIFLIFNIVIFVLNIFIVVVLSWHCRMILSRANVNVSFVGGNVSSPNYRVSVCMTFSVNSNLYTSI